MLADLLTIVRKEWKEVFLMRGSMRSGLLNLGIILGLLGIIMPLQTGRAWLTSPLPILMWSWVPVFTALGIITDAFAGERERHTLETLLASRLPDKAILFGKIAAAVLYAWGLTLVAMLLAVITVNIADPQGGFIFYPPLFLLPALVISLLAALLFSNLGVLVSLRAQTARQAYQRLSVVMIVLWLVPMLGIQFLPENARATLGQFFMLVSQDVILAVVSVVLVLGNILLLAAAQARFKRSRLVID